jgi:hypothetical protein
MIDPDELDRLGEEMVAVCLQLMSVIGVEKLSRVSLVGSPTKSPTGSLLNANE